MSRFRNLVSHVTSPAAAQITSYLPHQNVDASNHPGRPRLDPNSCRPASHWMRAPCGASLLHKGNGLQENCFTSHSSAGHNARFLCVLKTCFGLNASCGVQEAASRSTGQSAVLLQCCPDLFWAGRIHALRPYNSMDAYTGDSTPKHVQCEAAFRFDLNICTDNPVHLTTAQNHNFHDSVKIVERHCRFNLPWSKESGFSRWKIRRCSQVQSALVKGGGVTGPPPPTVPKMEFVDKIELSLMRFRRPYPGHWSPWLPPPGSAPGNARIYFLLSALGEGPGHSRTRRRLMYTTLPRSLPNPRVDTVLKAASTMNCRRLRSPDCVMRA